MFTLNGNLEVMRIQVAERLGWRSIEYSAEGCLIGYPPGRRVFAAVPSYPRDIKAAWMLVDYLALHGISIQIHVERKGNEGRVFRVQISYGGKQIASTQDLAIAPAICEAFLTILGDDLACLLKASAAMTTPEPLTRRAASS